jgi:hypothetical protein
MKGKNLLLDAGQVVAAFTSNSVKRGKTRSSRDTQEVPCRYDARNSIYSAHDED